MDAFQSLLFFCKSAPSNTKNTDIIVRRLKEDQPLLLNLLFYHFNRSKPTYKSQCVDVIAACNQLNVNALN